MIKRYLKIIIPIVVIIAIIIFVWWITDPYRIQNQNQPKEVVKQINFDNINLEDYGIYNTIKIDSENYILITRKLVKDENNIVSGIYDNNYLLYKYNLKNGIENNKLEINEYFQVAGIDVNKKIIYLAITNLVIPEGNIESAYNIIEINYETMEIKNSLMDKDNYYSCTISKDSNIWAYLINKSLYVSGYNFENEKILLETTGDIDNNIIYDIVNSKIVYGKYGSEEGIGIIDSTTNNSQFIQLTSAVYVLYNPIANELYYTDSQAMNTLMKVNMDTLEKTNVIVFDSDNEPTYTMAYISEDMKYLLAIKTQYTQGIGKSTLVIYDFNNRKIISQYELEETGNISNVEFLDKSIMYIQNDKLYKWNYLEK